MIFEKMEIPSIFDNEVESDSVRTKDLPWVEIIFKSGSTKEEKLKLKSFNPAKPESTINNEAEAITTPEAAITVIILMALLLLLVNK